MNSLATQFKFHGLGKWLSAGALILSYTFFATAYAANLRGAIGGLARGSLVSALAVSVAYGSTFVSNAKPCSKKYLIPSLS